MTTTTKYPITVTPISYEVTAYPDHDFDRHHFTITVEQRGPGSYGIFHSGEAWNRRTKKWDYEPLPSSRSDAYKRTHRFPLDEALEIAKTLAPTLSIMGWTMDQVIRRNAGEDICGEPIARGTRCDLIRGHEEEHKP